MTSAPGRAAVSTDPTEVRLERTKLLCRVRFWLALFMSGLVLSGLTAFPLRDELEVAVRVLQSNVFGPIAEATGLLLWIERVNQAVIATDASYPFLAYGTDWLAFAHLVIAAAFIGPLLDPVRNKWVVTFGLVACAGVIPLAMIAGQARDIPMGWRLIDCCFGILGAVPLLICRRSIDKLERQCRSAAGLRPAVIRASSCQSQSDISHPV